MSPQSFLPNKRHKRWVAITISVLVSFILISSLKDGTFTLLPQYSLSLKSPASRTSCPTRPPQPAYIPSTTTGQFDWRNLPQKYPVSSYAQLPTGRPSALPKVQFEFSRPSSEAETIRASRQAAVRESFRRCWKSYRDRAWLKDELSPVSGGSRETFGGWGATLVDSLDTLLIMGLMEEYNEAMAAAVNISFNPGHSTVAQINMFETTIRYLGGFLAAHDLTGCADDRPLKKAIELGDMIYASYDTPNRMPVTRWNPQDAAAGKKQEAAASGIIAELASSSLEFTRLSQLTGDMRYFDAISRITDIMEQQQNKTKLPGMWPCDIDLQTPDLTVGGSFTMAAMADSAYEYLGKMYQLLGGLGQASQYRKMYEGAMATAIEHSFFRPMTPDHADILIPANVHAHDPSNPRRDTQLQHLVCFVGGMLLLSGKLVGNATHMDVGAKSTNGCVWAYRNSPAGIMPEICSMHACPTWEECEFDEQQGGSPPGFASISDTQYLLRPEAVESVFYLYRITGDPKAQDMAWEMFQAIDQATRTEFANAALVDMTERTPRQADSMESFWMAETLKYLFLTFSEPDLISLDDYVFNTEAHPFRLMK